MQLRFQNKQTLFLLGAALLLVLIVFGFLISSLFSSSPNATPSTFPTPTPQPYTRNNDGTFNFTPLQKTVINRTTEKEVEQKEKILNKSRRGDVTIFSVPSATPQESDEIRTQNGRVIFESINVFNNKAGMPPKVNIYTKQFGQPEKVLKGVSPLGRHISAYIYAKEGFTLFVNHNTNTVYEIQRYTPMDTAEYETTYAEYVAPAPDYPQEFHGN